MLCALCTCNLIPVVVRTVVNQLINSTLAHFVSTDSIKSLCGCTWGTSIQLLKMDVHAMIYMYKVIAYKKKNVIIIFSVKSCTLLSFR